MDLTNNRLPEILREQAQSLISDPEIVYPRLEKEAFSFARHMRGAVHALGEMVHFIGSQASILQQTYQVAQRVLIDRREQYDLEIATASIRTISNIVEPIDTIALDRQLSTNKADNDHALRVARRLSSFFQFGGHVDILAPENLEYTGLESIGNERSKAAGKIFGSVIRLGEDMLHSPENAIMGFFDHFGACVQRGKIPAGYRQAQEVMDSLQGVGASMVDIRNAIPKDKAPELAEFIGAAAPALILPFDAAPRRPICIYQLALAA